MPNVSLSDFTRNFRPLVWARNTMPYVHARHKSINFLGYPSAAFLSANVLGSPLCNRVKRVYSVGNFIWFQGVNFSGTLQTFAVRLHAVSYLLPRRQNHSQTQRLLGITRGGLQSSKRHHNPAAIIHSAVVWDETSQLSSALWGFIFVFVVFPTCFPNAYIDNNFTVKDVISKSITLHHCNVLWLCRWLKVASKITLAWLRSLCMPPSFRGMAVQWNLTRTESIVFVSTWDN